MKVVITTNRFTTGESRGLEILQQAGLEVVNYEQEKWNEHDEAYLLAHVQDADCIIAGLEKHSAAVLAQCPKLKLYSRRGVGYDSIDVEACRRQGVAVARTVGVVEDAVAEHVLAYIFCFARGIVAQSNAMHAGRWEQRAYPGAKTRRLGLVGFGGIGKAIARRAVACGMQVSYYCRHANPAWEAEYGVRYLPLAELLAGSDYVSANMPLNDNTRGMFNASLFAQMKQGSIFINIARGGVMDDAALRQALDSGHLGGAAVDVFTHEPCTDSPLRGCPNVLLTPHTAVFTQENFALMNNLAAQNVVDFLRGTLAEKYRVV